MINYDVRKKVISATLSITMILCSGFTGAAVNAVSINSGSIQVNKLKSDIDKKITALNKEANQTIAIKEYLIASEVPAITTDLQSHIQQLEAIKTNLTEQNLEQSRQKLQSLRINSKIMPRALLRRRTALLYQYNSALSIKIQEFYTKINALQLGSPKLESAQTCIASAESKRVEGTGLLNGVLSQIGLFEATDKKDAMSLYRRLSDQIRQAKNSFDGSRKQMNSCYRQYLSPAKDK